LNVVTHDTISSGSASSMNLYVGQNPVVSTVTVKSTLGRRASSSPIQLSKAARL
jgi:hypothetical protein